MQGRLFESEWPVSISAAMDDDERLHAVALSVMAAPAGRGITGAMRTRMPRDICRMVTRVAAPETADHIVTAYPGPPLEAARGIMERAGAASVRVVSFWDGGYPPLLREIPDPPLVLYVRGAPGLRRAVAVVGTRMADARSAMIARRIGRELAGCGYTVVSGLATGIDREAHIGALDAGGATVGVLPGGIDIVYPLSNRDLYARIAGAPGSAVVSEYPPGIMIAGKWTFARRNRIISGLSAGTVVVKAGERSGALITARHALEQNREVFACAGHSFDRDYAGCNRLIRSGAVLVSATSDIIEELDPRSGMLPPAPRPAPRADEDSVPPPGAVAGKILALLGTGERDVDALIRATGVSPGEVHESIIELELEGIVIRSGNSISRV